MKAVSEVSAKRMDEKVATAEKAQQMLNDLQVLTTLVLHLPTPYL